MKKLSCLLVILINFNLILITEKVFSYTTDSSSLISMSLDQLMDIKVDTLMRVDNSYFETPSAVYVITSEDIRRSGMSTIPELLRMVPGINMTRLDGNTWAINIRGIAYKFAMNLLVMIDGRTLYSPLNNAVNWDIVDTMLPDIERIEVLRGPGSSLWGSNSANGIINIVTKKPSETKGGLIFAETGDGDIKNQYGMRYGAGRDNFNIRFYAKKRDLDNHHYPIISEQNHTSTKYHFSPLSESFDSGTLSTAGFKGDWKPSDKSAITLQGDIYSGEYNNIRTFSTAYSHNINDVSGYNMLLKWNNEFSDKSKTMLQLYFDYTYREDAIFLDERSIYDIDFQHTLLLPRNRLNWGLGYRYAVDNTDHYNNKFGFAVDPAKRYDDVASFFLHDEFFLIKDKLTLSGGAKFEHNDYTGFEYQPNIKLSFMPDNNQNFWLSFSRTLSIPSRSGSDAYLDLSGYSSSMCKMLGGVKDPKLGCIILVSDKDMDAARVNSYEAGYKRKLWNKLFFDAAFFYDEYSRNKETMHVNYVSGIETNIRYNPFDNWKLEFSYSYTEAMGEPKIYDATSSIPRNIFKMRSLLDINKNTELDVFLSYVDKAYEKNTLKTYDPYWRLDLRLGYLVSKNLEVSLIGTNLLDDSHTENPSDLQKALTTVDRAYLVRTVWNF